MAKIPVVYTNKINQAMEFDIEVLDYQGQKTRVYTKSGAVLPLGDPRVKEATKAFYEIYRNEDEYDRVNIAEELTK